MVTRQTLRKMFDFRRGELRAGILLFWFFFLTIGVFQILKPLKNGLFVEHYGAELELYAKLANIVVALAGVAVVSHLFRRVERQNLIGGNAIFFAVSFVLLGFFLRRPDHVSVWSFYLLGDLLSTMMVAAFWAYLTDIADLDQAKRLFGPIGAGGVLGGWAGSAVPKTLLDNLGSGGLLLLCAAMMGVVAWLIYAAERRVGRSAAFRKRQEVRRDRPAPGGGARDAIEGAGLVVSSKYLLAIAGMMAFYEVTSQVMDFQFKLASQTFPDAEQTQAFLADIYFYANLLSVAVQFLAVSFVLRALGLTTALLILPVALLGGAGGFMLAPSLWTVSLMVILDNGLNYSLQQTARESLFTPLSREAKYKARAFINMFVQRLAKGLGIVGVIGLEALGFGVPSLSAVAIGSLIFLALCGWYAGRRFPELCEETQPDRYAA
jgi:AAA family ATP:ADP antiporter